MRDYKLEIWHDDDAERPDENTTGRMVSFGRHHINYEDPDLWLEHETECVPCDGNGVIDDGGTEHECSSCEGYGYTLSTHPDALALLSYYEHGPCRWMVGESTVPDPGSFDTVNVAGVIVWNGDESEREWWQSLDVAHQRLILDGIASEYTSWVNGDSYGYTIAHNDFCMECGHELDSEPMDSCSGLIGKQQLGDAVCEALTNLNIDPADVEIRGEFAYVLDELDLLPKDKVVT